MPNPYLQDSANAITQQANNNLFNYQLPQINSGAIAAGGFGGSRHGVVQGLAIGQTNQGISNALANQSYQAWDSDQNRATQQAMQQNAINAQQRLAEMQNQTTRDLGFSGLANQRYGMDQNFGLGVGGLANQRYGMDLNYGVQLGQLGLGARAADTSQYNAETQRGLGWGQLQQQGDMNAFNQQQAGFNSQLAALNALQGWNTNGVNLANQQQQIPLQNLGLLSNIGASIGGQGSSVTQPGASTVGSALGGALTAAQLWKLLSGG